ncbi:MAG TPA: NAD(P)-dependent oxidoreductase [Cyanobacteria bacterium UBA8530]|nr:NAD(P)-dependent oxidoreductase [Cyanobacteria bacterium UBA8530]
MSRLKGKLVLITGASSGIGAACARAFAERGARLLLCARRLDRLESLAEELKECEVHCFALDVSRRAEVEEKLALLPSEWREIDILVNNAGLSRGLDKLHEAEVEDWEEMIDTNLKGLLYVSRAIIPGMVERGRGQVLNLGSIAGHEAYPGGSVYCATKHAVSGLTKALRMDLLGTPIRVSSVDPGMVETEFSLVRFHGNEEKAAKVYQGLTPLAPEDVAEVVLFCATRPPHVNLSEVMVLPTDQASALLSHRK